MYGLLISSLTTRYRDSTAVQTLEEDAVTGCDKLHIEEKVFDGGKGLKAKNTLGIDGGALCAIGSHGLLPLRSSLP